MHIQSVCFNMVGLGRRFRQRRPRPPNLLMPTALLKFREDIFNYLATPNADAKNCRFDLMTSEMLYRTTVPTSPNISLYIKFSLQTKENIF